MPKKPSKRQTAKERALDRAIMDWRGNQDYDAAIRGAFAEGFRAGRRARGKPLAKGFVGEKPEYDSLGRLLIEQQWTPDARVKVEVRKV